MNRELQGKIALVTGASRLNGIGAAICKSLARNGISIYFTYWLEYDKKMPWRVKEEEPQILEEIIKKLGVKCFRKELDLSISENIEILFKDIENTIGIPDILVNNACFSSVSNYETINESTLDNHYKVNIRATTLLSSYFGRLFNKETGGRIINISSGQFKGAMVNELAYATTKGAVDALTITLAGELGEKGITVNAINPGPTDTGWMTENVRNKLKNMFSTKRVGTPGDVANIVNLLVSESSRWITGQIIDSAGGFYL